MLKQVAATGAALFTIFSAECVDAMTYTANFGMTNLDPALFVYDTATNISEATGSGVLTVTQAPGNTAAPGQLLIATKFAVIGDFSFSVTANPYGLTGAPIGVINVNFAGTPNLTYAGESFGRPIAAQTSVYAGGQDNGLSEPNGGVLTTGYNNLEITRVGETITESASGYVFNSFSGADFLGAASFSAGLNDYLGAGGGGSVSYSDFVITTGVPEPSTWAFLLIGFAGLGAILRSIGGRGHRITQVLQKTSLPRSFRR